MALVFVRLNGLQALNPINFTRSKVFHRQATACYIIGVIVILLVKFQVQGLESSSDGTSVLSYDQLDPVPVHAREGYKGGVRYKPDLISRHRDGTLI